MYVATNAVEMSYSLNGSREVFLELKKAYDARVAELRAKNAQKR
jgi:hypothetical protein